MTRSAQQTQRLLKLLVRLGPEYTQQARSLFFNSQNLEIKGALQHQRFSQCTTFEAAVFDDGKYTITRPK